MRSKFHSFHPLTLRGRPERIPPALGVRRSAFFRPMRRFLRKAALKKPSEIIVDCKEANSLITLEACWQCCKYREWHKKDGDLRRCYYDYEFLASTGFYDDPPQQDESPKREMEEIIRRNEQIAKEMEIEKRELEALAQLLEKRMPSYLFDESEGDGEEEGEENDEENADQIDDENGEISGDSGINFADLGLICESGFSSEEE